MRTTFLPNGAVANAIQLDAAGNIYITGTITPAKPQSSTDGSDIFVAKLLPDGAHVVYWTLLSGDGYDIPRALAFGGDGSANIIGNCGYRKYRLPLGIPFALGRP